MVENCIFHVVSDHCFIFSKSSSDITKRVELSARDGGESILPDIFSNFHIYDKFNTELSPTFLLGVIVSNEESVWKPCMQLFSFECLSVVSKLGTTFENIQLYLSICSCVAPSLCMDIHDGMSDSKQSKLQQTSSAHLWILLFLAESFGNEVLIRQLLGQLYTIVKTQSLSLRGTGAGAGGDSLVPVLLPAAMMIQIPTDCADDLSASVYRFFTKYEEEFMHSVLSPSGTGALSNDSAGNGGSVNPKALGGADEVLYVEDSSCAASADTTVDEGYSPHREDRAENRGTPSFNGSAHTPNLERMVQASWGVPADHHAEVDLKPGDHQPTRAEINTALAVAGCGMDTAMDSELASFHLSRKASQKQLPAEPEAQEQKRRQLEERQTLLQAAVWELISQKEEREWGASHSGRSDGGARTPLYDMMGSQRDDWRLQDLGGPTPVQKYRGDNRGRDSHTFSDPDSLTDLEGSAGDRDESYMRQYLLSSVGSGRGVSPAPCKAGRGLGVRDPMHPQTQSEHAGTSSSGSGSGSGGRPRPATQPTPTSSALEVESELRMQSRIQQQRQRKLNQAQEAADVELSKKIRLRQVQLNASYARVASGKSPLRPRSPGVSRFTGSASVRTTPGRSPAVRAKSPGRLSGRWCGPRASSPSPNGNNSRLSGRWCGPRASSPSPNGNNSSASGRWCGPRASSPSPNGNNSRLSGRWCGPRASSPSPNGNNSRLSIQHLSDSGADYEVLQAQYRAALRVKEKKRELDRRQQAEKAERRSKQEKVWEARDRKISDFLRRQQEAEEQQEVFSAIKQKQKQARASHSPRQGARGETVFPERDERNGEYSFAYEDDEDVRVVSQAGERRPSTPATTAPVTPAKMVHSTTPLSKERGPVFTQGSQQSKEALIAVGLLSPEPPPPPSSSYTVPESQRKLYQQQRKQQLLLARQDGTADDSFTSIEPREQSPQPQFRRRGEEVVDIEEVESMIDSVLGVQHGRDGERPSTPPPPPPLAQYGYRPQERMRNHTQVSPGTSMEQDSMEIPPPPTLAMFVIRVNEAFHLTEGLGEMKPYVVFDWDFLGKAHTQAVSLRQAMADTGSNSDGEMLKEDICFCYNSTLKFRTPKLPPNATENPNHRLYTLLSHAPALCISIYNRNDSVSDEKLGEVLIPNVIELYLSKNPHNVAPLKTTASRITSENLAIHVNSQNNGIRGCLVQCDQLDGTGQSAGCVSFDILIE